MAYNFLGLVNDVNNRLNEVELTSVNFATATGYYATVKEAVNSSIRFINQEDYYWPFNYNAQDDTLVAGTLRYNYPADAKKVDFNTFRIQRDANFGNDTVKLRQMDYEQFLENYADYEYNTSDSIHALPRFVSQTPGQEYLISPPPDQAYTLSYEYYSLPTDLEASTDTPSCPVAFRHVIVDGAMYYLYMFRADTEMADRLFVKYTEGIKNMKAIYINRHEYLRDTRVQQGGLASAGYLDLN